MDKKSFTTLEYYKIIEKLKGYCSSNLAVDQVSTIEPLEDIGQINKLLDKTSDAIELIIKYSMPPLYGIFNLEDIVKRLNMGGILENYQFRQIADSLRVSADLKDYVSQFEAENIIKDQINLLYTNARVEKEIERIIVDDETIADDASRALLSIRRSIRNKSEEIRRKLNSIITDKNAGNILQENIVTMRDGRYVVPVKSSSKSSFAGIAHDRSATGQTVYIEPMVVVELNNEIRQLQIEEHDEIRRILKELSLLCGQYGEEILSNQNKLLDLDITFAKAKMALDMKATRPLINDDGYINIKNARHPLLKVDNVVPIDIVLGNEYNALVITGPNTGGKTVSLKTLGLLILMSQSGFYIPADDFSKVGVFKNIYADIGDKQSIELSLSTFSASMTNIVEILNKADESSLVLFDELGSGTDPTEGAALAMSIIDYLLKRDVTLVTTTHYSELKLYAMTTQRVQNASVEFDVESLRPTFRLVIGMPGKSNAFEISRRLGLSEDVLNHASSYISKENRDFEGLISEIETDRIRAENELRDLEVEKKKYEELNRKLEDRVEDKMLLAQKNLDDSKEEARKILEEARREAKHLIKLAKESSGNVSDLDRSYSQINDKYQQLQDKYEKRHKKKEKQDKVDFKIKLGQTVRILSMDDLGVVQSLPDNKGDLIVQVGILKFNVNISDLMPDEKQVKEKKKGTSAYRKVLQEKAESSYSQSIDLRGKNIDESIGEIEKFFDNSIILGLKEVQIIHGKGTGALRKGITQYLKKSRYVDSFRLGTLKEGGAGVTVVSLK
ncbi:MAG: endonuclease MutS2 [Tissierellia bacterium]|nr:endonuclease MutS2 [Tissierellia bacterium]